MANIDSGSAFEINRISIEALLNEPLLKDFVQFCVSCDIHYMDEISNIIFIAYKTQNGLDSEKMRKIKKFIFDSAHPSIQEKANIIKPTKIVEITTDNQPKLVGNAIVEETENDYEEINAVDLEEKIEKEKLFAKDIDKDESDEEDSVLQYNSKYALLRTLPVPQHDGILTKKDDGTDFQTTSIESLGLSHRTTNILLQNDIVYLYQLMDLTISKFQEMQRVGEKSIAEFIQTQRKYEEEYARISKTTLPTDVFSKQIIFKYILSQLDLLDEEVSLDGIKWIQKETFIERLNLCIETLGIELCQLLWQSDSKLNEWLMPLLAEMSREAEYIHMKAEMDSKICCFDRVVLFAPAMSMANAYCDIANIAEQDRLILEQSISSCGTISDIKKARFELNDKNYLVILAFVDWLSFDLKGIAIDLINKCVNKKMGILPVVDLRSQGYTLEAIAKQKKQTRERVRQLESYAVKACKCEYNNYHIIRLISAIRNDDMVITEQEFLKAINIEAGPILLYLLKNIDNDEFLFDKDTGIFRLTSAKIDRDSIEKDVSKLPDFIFYCDWMSELDKIAVHNNTTIEYVEKIATLSFRNYDKYYSRGKLSLRTIYGYILKKYYPNGMKLYDGIEYPHFRELVKEVFGDTKMPSNNHAMDSIIQRTAILCDRGTYIHPDNIFIDLDLITRIDQYIQDMPRTAISYAELYDTFKDELLLKTSIHNRFYLQGVLKYFLNDKYFSIKDLISKDCDVKLDDEINEYVKECQYVTRRELLEHFKGLRESAICQILVRCPEVIGIDNAKYIHSSSLKLKPQDYKIKAVIESNIQTCPLSTRRLLDILYLTYSDFLDRNDIDTHTKLFGIMNYMFSNDFSFSRPYIAKKGSKNITNESVILSLLDGYDTIEIEELMTICEEHKINFLSMNGLISNISDGYIRISKTELMSCDCFDITDTEISQIKKQLSGTIYAKGYVSLLEPIDYMFFPDIGVQWNAFLLRSILQKFDDEFVLIDIPSTDGYNMTTIVVNPTLKLETYEQLMEFLTIKENKLNTFSDASELEDWYRTEGLIITDIPSVIANSTWMQITKDRNIIIGKKEQN